MLLDGRGHDGQKETQFPDVVVIVIVINKN
jgi:hypothetical protein